MVDLSSRRDSEDLVEQLCSIIFLRDFTVRNPKFRKSSGQEKEAADFLVPFFSTLIAFQVKSKSEFKSALEKDETDFARIRRRVDNAIDQLKTIKRALEAEHISQLVNPVGFDLSFTLGNVHELIGVVIIDLIGEEDFPEEERTEIYNGFEIRNDIPTHIFMLDSFEVIASEIDTLPDFLEYLEVRAELLSNGVLAPLTDERNFLALYKTNPEAIQECRNGECDTLVLDESLWTDYREHFEQQIEQRDELNQPSYIIDHIISVLHTSVGSDPEIETSMPTEPMNSVASYWSIVSELSQLSRLQRRGIGEKFLEKMKQADDVGYGYSLIRLSNEAAMLVFSADEPRQRRVKGLENLASIACCALNLSKVIAVVTEPLSERSRSYDAMVLEDIDFENPAELTDHFKKLFGHPQHYQIFEYGN